MNVKVSPWLLLVTFLLCSGLAAAQAKECTPADAAAAESLVPAATWGALYQSYRKYAQCDDGSVAEVFSNSVALLLSGHWDAVSELTKLDKAHPSFGKFVLHHTDVTMSLDQAGSIRGNARDRCPADSKGLCERILHRMSEFK
jgi:hypothetical protein